MKLHASWAPALKPEFEKPYFQELKKSLEEERKNHTVYPKNGEVFRAFELTPLDKLKVVILGQDPYHGPGQAHGLAFSVPVGVPVPPSLVNILKELESDLGIVRPNHGCLEAWARQGVLLLNTALTVRDGQAGSHAGLGWETFTDHVISEISERKEAVAFLLWGKHAQSKAPWINSKKHGVFFAAHPSPLSANRGFLGCRHFSQASSYLAERQIEGVDFRLPEQPVP